MSDEIIKSLKVMQTYDSETGLVVLTVSLDDLNKVLKTMDKQAKWMNQRLERLTKAGDELHAFLINYIVESRISSAYLNKLDDDWQAAKEDKTK